MRRWQSIGALQAEVQKLLLADSEEEANFEEVLDGIRTQVLQTPANVVRDQLEKVDEAAARSFRELAALLQNKLRGVILGIQGNFPFTRTSDVQWSQGLAFNTRYHGPKWFRCAFYIVRDKDELGVRGYSDTTSGAIVQLTLSSQTGQEIARFGIFDPDVEGILKRAFQQFFATNIAPMLTDG
jgi:hypothetical protein